MKLPRAEHAFVPPGKVSAYLLSRTNPRSQHKADFFEGLGFSQAEWEVLAAALVAHGRSCEVADRDDTMFGTWYTVEGPLDNPLGTQQWVRTVWFVDSGATVPRFVTAYPLRRRRP